MAIDGLSCHRKYPLIFTEVPDIEIALHPVLQGMVGNGDVALRGALQRGVTGAPGALLQGFQDHTKVVAVVDERVGCQGEDFGHPGASGPHQIQDQTERRMFFSIEQGQDLWLDQVDRHRIDGIEHGSALGDQALPVDAYRLNRKVIDGRIDRPEQASSPRSQKSGVADHNLYHFIQEVGAISGPL